MSKYIYDISLKQFLDDQGTVKYDFLPIIVFGQKPTWEIVLMSNRQPVDLSGVYAWRAAVAEDMNPATRPMCRTTSGIVVQEGAVIVPLSANTDTFCGNTANRCARTCIFELVGLDSNGDDSFYVSFRVLCKISADPSASGAIQPVESTELTRPQIQAIAVEAARNEVSEIQEEIDSAVDSARQNAQAASDASATAATYAASAYGNATSAETAAQGALASSAAATQSAASASASADQAALSTTEAERSMAQAAESAQAASAAAGSASASSAEAIAAASSAAASENDAELASSAAGLHAEEAQAAVEECRNLSQVRPPACTDLGISRGQSQVEVTWGDPANLVQSGWVLCETQRTVLVAKSGGYPESPEDGTIVAATSRNPQTDAYPLPSGVSYQYLGYYRLTPITVQLPEADDVCLKLFSCSRSGAWNSLPANEYPSYTDYSWGQLAEYADAGTFLSHVPLGSAIQAGHADFPNMEWLVVGDDMFNRADLTARKTVGLIMRYVPFTSQYDAPEDTWALTEDTAAVTGVKYGLNINGTITAVTEHTDWEPGDTSITRDGVEYPISVWMERNPNTNQGSGTNLSSQSNLLQWANSDGPANNWFVKQNLWDKCASQLVGKNGFLLGLPQSFRDCLVDVRKTAYVYAAYRIRERGASEAYDAKVFPLSSYEIFGTAVGSVTEGKKKADLFEANADRIAYLEDGVTPQTWWSASANTNNANSVYCVSAAGASASNYASNAFGVRLACTLGKQDS